MARTFGASDEPTSYFRAIAKWVGLVITAVAFGTSSTAADWRAPFAAVSICIRLIFAFTSGEPSVVYIHPSLPA